MSNEVSIFEFVPEGYELREAQVYALTELYNNWHQNDVFVLQASVGSGKSVIAQTVARWLNHYGVKVTTITPQVVLQNQYERSFPDVLNVKGATRYECGRHPRLSCRAVKDAVDKFCPGCPYADTISKVEDSYNTICNFHSYIQHEAFSPVLICDEGHNILKHLQEYLTVIFWKDKHKFPDDLPTYQDLAEWVEKLLTQSAKTLAKTSKDMAKAKKLLEACKDVSEKEKIIDALAELSKTATEARSEKFRYGLVLRCITECPEPMFVEKTKLERYGKQVEAIRLRPKTLTGLPKILWPESMVEKIIIMSGTINMLDVAKLGLGHKRVKLIKVPNPIPAERREIVPITTCNLSFEYQEKNLPKLVAVLKGIMELHPGKKGVIHTTYGLANKLWHVFNGPQIIYHSSDDKEKKLKEFMDSSDKILVACGMSEGLDLPGEDYTWQVITKVMWPNKGDKLIEHLYNTEPDYVTWQTLSTVVQQTGRICRGPTDKGTTYVVDTTFGNPMTGQKGLYQRAKAFMDPDFEAAINWKKGQEIMSKIGGLV